jgi:DNA-binding transcriptional MocR family regulator
MTIWRPSIEEGAAPLYQAIADAIQNDVEAGVLTVGTRLPTHRDLAAQVGVTVGTVSRGYAEAERRGLTSGEVGRGTFVRGHDIEGHGWPSPPRSEVGDVIDMSLATPWSIPKEGELLAATLKQIAEEPGLNDLLRYDPETASHSQRAAAASWITRNGMPATPEQTIVTVGAQHAITVLFSTLLRPGDTVLCGQLTYPGMKGVAQMLGLRLRGVAMDEEGLLPDALDVACRESSPRALYCVPTLQNPTCALMSQERRQEIARVAQKHDLLIVEDDVHAFSLDKAPRPLSLAAPERSIHLSTISKSVTFGLRTGFVVAPDHLVERIRAGVRSTVWMPAVLTTEVTARWLTDGTADHIAKIKRAEVRARNEIVREVLGNRYDLTGHEAALHFWLRLPEPWRSDECVGQAKQRGVLVAGAEAFAIGRKDVPHAVRVCIGSVPNRDDLRRGLEILGEVLEGCCDPCANIL